MKIQVKGLVNHTSVWVDLASVDIDSDTTKEQIEEAVTQFQEFVATTFKEKLNGQLTVGSSVINVQSFAAISVEALQ